MRIVERYLLKEILGPLGLGFIGYTFILLMQFLFRSAEMIIRRGVPAEKVLELVTLSLPNMVVLTIPMALLFAILVSIGKLSASSELTAMRASGVSLLRLYRPILLLSLVLAALNCGLMLTALPWGNSRLQDLTLDILRTSAARQLEPRVFYEEWEGLVVYVFEVTPEGRWNGVFLAETGIGAENEITVAEWGELRADQERQNLVLHLGNAVRHRVDFDKPEEYDVYGHRSLQRVLEGLPQHTRRAYKSLRELDLAELRAVLREPGGHPSRYNLARVEIHKKFAIPAACVVFALLALPLGFSQQRGGRGSGFAVSVLIILIYYVMLNNGEEAARVGKMAPWLAMWLPNLIFFVAGAFLLLRKNRDQSLMLGRIDAGLRRVLWRGLARLQALFEARRERRAGKRAGRGDAAPRAVTGGASDRDADLVLKLPRPGLRFPSIMDRYVAKLFFRILVLVVFSALSLKLIADFTERVDDIMNNEVVTEVVVDYYKYLALDVLFQLSPIAVLITTLIVFGLLSRSNELVAAKALGMSLYRLSAPVLAAALVVVGVAAYLQARVLPVTNEKVARLDDKMRGREVPRSYRRADRNWLFGQGRYIYNYLHYDARTHTLHQLQVFEFDERRRLSRRLYASRARYLGDAWRFDEAWKRSFDGLRQQYTPASGPVVDNYPETPAYFESDFKLPNAMTYGELERYIGEVKESGEAVPELEVELAHKIGYPVTNLVMALLALPFSFRLGRRGALYGMGIGVVLGMVFLGVYAFSRTLGEAGALPALVAIWAPSVAFAVASVYLFLGVET